MLRICSPSSWLTTLPFTRHGLVESRFRYFKEDSGSALFPQKMTVPGLIPSILAVSRTLPAFFLSALTIFFGFILILPILTGGVQYVLEVYESVDKVAIICYNVKVRLVL